MVKFCEYCKSTYDGDGGIPIEVSRRGQTKTYLMQRNCHSIECAYQYWMDKYQGKNILYRDANFLNSGTYLRLLAYDLYGIDDLSTILNDGKEHPFISNETIQYKYL